MGTKKDIGNAFKERLSEFNDSPNNIVWENIEAKLKKEKEDDRVIPFWLKYGSIAAVLLMILFLNKDSIFNNNSPKNTINTSSNTVTNNENKKSDLINSSNQSNNPINTKILNSKEGAIIALNTNNSSSKTTATKSTSIYKADKKVASNNDVANNLNFKEKTSNILPKEFGENIIEKTLLDSISNSNELASNEEELKKELTIEDSIKSPQKSKWSVYPNASIVYYDGFKTSFKNQTSITYGIYFNYIGSDKFNFRLGVNKLNLKQTYTNNNSTIKQEVNYIEVPLEIKYALTQHKIKTYFVGGFSYLFLNDATKTSTDESNINLIIDNSDSFNQSTLSLNAGLSFQTKIYNNLYLNLEPMFKYHFEPYSVQNDFNPFVISITSGLEYKF